MDKKSLKELLEHCKVARFHEALTSIQENAWEIDSKSAIALIVGCCNSCVTYMSSPAQVSENDLFSLLQLLKPFLVDLSESEVLSYLQSIFFILKLLVKKRCYSTIAKLEEIILPEFLPSALEKKQNDTYQSSAGLLHNLVVKFGSEKTSKYNESLLKIGYITSKVYSKVGNITSLLSVAYNCIISLFNLESPTEEMEKYFLHVLNLIDTNRTKIYSEEEFKPFLNTFMLVLNAYLKKFDFTNSASFYKKVFLVASKIFETDYISALTLVRLPLILTPSNFSTQDVNECREALENLNGTLAKKIIENKLNPLLYTVVFSYYKSVRNTDWCELSDEDKTEILTLIHSLAKFESRSEYSCSCKCSIGKNIYCGFTYSQYICVLIEFCVSSNVASKNFHENSSKLLEKFCEKIHVLKTRNCQKWITAWNTLGTSIYNIGVHLYQKSNEACLYYFYMLIKFFIKFEVKSNKTVLKSSLIPSSFTAICALNARDYRKNMAFTALAIFLCPNQNENLTTAWIKAKVSLRDAKSSESDDAQKITIVTAFEKFEKELFVLTDGEDLLNNQDKVNLLITELEQYKKRWKSKVPMMAALKQLCDIADIQTSVKTIVKIFGDCETNLHDDVPKILLRVLKTYEKKTKKSDESNIYLAVLYFLHYKYCIKDTISKNADEMEKSMLCVPQSNEPPDAIPRDPTEECDIVSSYESLRLDKYSRVMKNLNKSLTLFASVIKDDFNLNIESISNSAIYDLLLKISFEYRLHCHRLKNLQALEMALKLAKVDNDACRIVETISFIIEHCDVTKDYINRLILLADKLLADVTLSNLPIALTYYICKAKAYVYHDHKEAFRIYQAAKELYDAQGNKNDLELIKCQLLMLHYKFVLMPCSFRVLNHKESTLLTIHSANATIFEAYNKSKIVSAYEMSILLEANEELAKLYHNLRCPREVRAYCRETVILAQKLVLPFRCATYLVYLAHADLRSTRYEDCQVKLDGVADILCLTKHNVQVEEEVEEPTCGGIEKEVEALTNEMQEMVLDLPVPNHYRKQFSPSSPTLVIKPFYLPAFVKHSQSCDCFSCVCFEYQALVLEKIRLDALINVKQDNPKVATDFFLGAMELYRWYIKRYKGFRDSASKLVALDLVPEFQKEFLPAYGGALLNYSYHLVREKNKSEALNVTNKLLEMVMPRKIDLVHLYSEVLVQKLGYVTETPDIVVSTDLDVDVDLNGAHSVETAKTPESKHSKVTVQKQSSPKFSPLKRITKKALTFNLSPDDETKAEEKPKKLSPTSKRALRTPGPKIQIYDEELILKTKTPAPNIQIFTDKKSTKKKNPTFLPPLEVATPTAPQPPKNDVVLKSRTKLLTEKLRQSTKKTEGGDEGTSGSSEGKRPSVRKNLLSELGGGDGDQGVVKRVTRQRKL